MADGETALILARAQFAFTVSFHFIFPALTIGLASYLAVLEALWLKNKSEVSEEDYKELLVTYRARAKRLIQAVDEGNEHSHRQAERLVEKRMKALREADNDEADNDDAADPPPTNQSGAQKQSTESRSDLEARSTTRTTSSSRSSSSRRRRTPRSASPRSPSCAT